MRNVAMAVLGLVFVAGCGSNVVGTNVAGGVTLSDARSACLGDNPIASEADAFEAIILIGEAARDDGGTESSFIDALVQTCDPMFMNECILCMSRIGAVIWN